MLMADRNKGNKAVMLIFAVIFIPFQDQKKFLSAAC